MSTTETLAPPLERVSPKKNGAVYETKFKLPSTPEWKGYEKLLFRFAATRFVWSRLFFNGISQDMPL